MMIAEIYQQQHLQTGECASYWICKSANLSRDLGAF